MAKVFRLHEGQDGTGWFTSTPITKEQLQTIKTEGKDVASSIPSPFARIDLIKSAFRWVAEHKIDGNTSNHKLVSDALDVAQLFFNSQKFKEKIEIAAWNPQERFNNLKGGSDNRHSKFANTLQLFWNQDSVLDNDLNNRHIYNFERVKRFYFLINKETNLVIGGTSPATVFFSAPDVRKVTRNLKIKIGQKVLFDENYASLAHRATSFIKYIYTLAKQPGFASLFPEVFAYLEEIRINHLLPELQTKIANIDPADIDNYASCPVLNNENDPCEILGIPLGIEITNGDDIENESDFVIRSDFPITGQKPLVLPYHRFSKNWTYTTNGIIWDENNEIPYKNTFSPMDSRLPILQDPHYWLSIGNFLEDKIIELPYSIDPTKFRLCGAKKHLLPLTSTFFKYFDVEKISDYFRLEEKSGGLIIAELIIPVKGGEISYKKYYSESDKNIEKLEIHLAVLPFLRAEHINFSYTIGLLDDRLDKQGEFYVKCYEKGGEVGIDAPVVRNPGTGGELKSAYYKTGNHFDLLGINNQIALGFIVPIFPNYQGNKQVNFAIDFGTTNTHIEYFYGEHSPKSLDNLSTSPLWQSLINRNDKIIDPEYFDNEITFEQEMFPYTFSTENDQPGFPIRTALVHNQQININENIDLFRQINNYMLLEKRSVPNYLELITQLKWSNYADSQDEKKVESYIEFLTTMAFFKTIVLGGDPTITSIIWFYPVSMGEGELGIFSKLWKDVFNRVFGVEPSRQNLNGIPESLAPYFYYKSSVLGLSLSIDIGGGSSDIAVFDEDDENAKIISSIKFAGNAIFGDGYPSNQFKNDSDKNGFVYTFKEEAYKAVKGDKQKEKILANILDVRKDSSDFSNFLFALEQDSSLSFQYSRLLQKDKWLKLSIFVFYGSIAFYSANLLKKSGIKIPRYILFSGTASKTVKILDPDELYDKISTMFQFIFEKVFGEESHKKISIEVSVIPKEITCKGVLKANIQQSIMNVPVKFWIGGMQSNEWSRSLEKSLNVQQTPKYKDIDDSVKSEIENSIKIFYSILDDYVKGLQLNSKYTIEPKAYEVFKRIRNIGITDFLVRGIKAFYKKDDEHIEESLFFYPLIGILNKLSFELSKKDGKNA